MWCDHSNEKEMSACKKIMLNSSHSKGQDYLSFVSPFDVCLSLMFFLVFVDSCCKDMLSKSTLSDWFSCFYSQKSYWSWFKRLWVILQSQSFRPHELSTLRNSFIEKGGETTIQDELTGRAGLCHHIGSASRLHSPSQKKLDVLAAEPLWPQNKSIQKQTIHRKTTFLNMLRWNTALFAVG